MVLYINGNYPHHSLHSELVSKLADMGNEITVYVPLKDKELIGKYNCEHERVKVLYRDCLNNPDRVFFLLKIHKLAKDIENTVDMTKVDGILAGTVYSDGAVAFFLHKKYQIPFSVAVRETDVTYQMKWRPYLNGFIKSLLAKASTIIFLSPAYKTYLEKFGCDHRKYEIIPNAVNDFWFQDQSSRHIPRNPLSLVYVGEISKRKNVSTTISVVKELNDRGVPTEFHIIGSGDQESICRDLTRQLGVDQQVFFHGWQNGKDKIRAMYDQADVFIMPSLKETFGTVYVEALSQGLPIIYTKGQGIFGYFEEGDVGYACDPTNVKEIADNIISIIHDYHAFSQRCIKASKLFQWSLVASQYNDVIRSMRKDNVLT